MKQLSFSQLSFSHLSFTKEIVKVDHLYFVRLWFWLGMALIIAIVVLSLASIPAPVSKYMPSDKILHCAVYACLMGWFAQIFKHNLIRAMLVVLFIGLGVAVEYAQALTPTRQFEVLDMVANTSGVILAWSVSYTWVGSILEWFEKSVLRTNSSVVVAK